VSHVHQSGPRVVATWLRAVVERLLGRHRHIAAAQTMPPLESWRARCNV
jgi:hypothetical protein